MVFGETVVFPTAGGADRVIVKCFLSAHGAENNGEDTIYS